MRKQTSLLITCLASLLSVNSFAADKLLQSTDLTYLGAFRVPQGDLGGPLYHGLSYGGSAIAYNPDHNSLFIVGHDQDQLVAEISIPQPVNSSSVSTLNTAAVLQNLSDVTEGNRINIGLNGAPITDNAVKIGGLLSYGNQLLGTSYGYYDASWEAVLSHFTSGKTLSATGDFQGMYQVGATPSPVPQAGYVAGVMTPVPSDWQAALGGPVLTGQGCLSIIGRTSLGPAAFAFDPANFGSQSPVPATALTYYTLDHPTLGVQRSTNDTFNGSSHVSGVIFPSNTQSILFTGWHGIGQYCYGKPTTDLSLNQTTDPTDGVMWCYDPTSDPSNKGSHAYPYVYQVWAYNAADLAHVKNGDINPATQLPYQPWDVTPYAVWHLNYPTSQSLYSIFSGASAYDEATHTLYIAQVGADNSPTWGLPLIHVFHVDVTSGATDVVAPTVAIAAPLAGSTLSGTVSISASASDNVGVSKVELYLDGALQSTDVSAPYNFSWNSVLVANGSHTLTAKAYDAAGNVGLSSPVLVTVVNDTIAPTASIVYPAAGSTVSGAVSVSASASDNVGVTKVEFYVNGSLQATDSSAPYNFSWNTLALANGSYTITMKAYDAAGNVGQASSVVKVFNDTIAPTVTIASPIAGSKLSGTVSVSVNASDNVGVTKVALYVNNVLQASNTSAPYTFSWNTTSVANGTYTLTAKAYDAAGNVGNSSSVAVSVSNSNPSNNSKKK